MTGKIGFISWQFWPYFGIKNLPIFQVGTIHFINKPYYAILLVHITKLCHRQYSKEKQLSETFKYWNNTEDAQDNSRGRNGNRNINGNIS